MARAQDPARVTPKTHKVVFENNRVRVLDIRVRPGQSAPMHSHPDYVFYALNDFKVKFTYPNGKTEKVAGKAGQIAWRGAEAHSAKNVGTSQLHVLNFELKGAAKKARPAKKKAR